MGHLSAEWLRGLVDEPIQKAYAVVQRQIRRDEVSRSPRSSTWTLYNPIKFVNDLINTLGLNDHYNNDTEELTRLDVAIHDLLEENGYSKAVRIREELIKWKQRLLDEDRELNKAISLLQKKKDNLINRRNSVKEQLVNVRNVLRLPREHVEVTKE